MFVIQRMGSGARALFDAQVYDVRVLLVTWTCISDLDLEFADSDINHCTTTLAGGV